MLFGIVGQEDGDVSLLKLGQLGMPGVKELSAERSQWLGTQKAKKAVINN